MLRGIAETMLPDGTRRLTVTFSEAGRLEDMAEVAYHRWKREAELHGMRLRYVRCVETRWGEDGLIGGVFEAELEKA